MTFLLTFLVLLLDFWAIVNLSQSNLSPGMKIAWAAVIVLFPFAGLVVWYFAAPKARERYA